MSDSTEKKGAVECYKKMGLSLSDPPPEVEKAYQKIKRDYAKAMRSDDPVTRNNMKVKLQELEEMYTTVTSSLAYKEISKQYEKKQEEDLKARQQKLEEEMMNKVICPNCGKILPASFKVCIFCSKTIKISFLDKLMFWK